MALVKIWTQINFSNHHNRSVQIAKSSMSHYHKEILRFVVRKYIIELRFDLMGPIFPGSRFHVYLDLFDNCVEDFFYDIKNLKEH